jgi:hypothetical protein
MGRLTAHQRAKLLDTVERSLTHQPTLASRNRKLLRANSVAPWELRIGQLRVYFDVSARPMPVVTVRAVGVKIREQVFIGGKVADLG